MISGLLLGMVLSVCTCWFLNVVNLLLELVSNSLVHGHTGVLCLLLLLLLLLLIARDVADIFVVKMAYIGKKLLRLTL